VTTGSELEEVQGEDGRSLNTGNVAESADELLAIGLWVVNDQRATASAVSSVSQLTLTSAELA